MNPDVSGFYMRATHASPLRCGLRQERLVSSRASVDARAPTPPYVMAEASDKGNS